MADKLLEAINMEPDPEIVGIMMDSLCKVSRAQQWDGGDGIEVMGCLNTRTALNYTHNHKWSNW